MSKGKKAILVISIVLGAIVLFVSILLILIYPIPDQADDKLYTTETLSEIKAEYEEVFLDNFDTFNSDNWTFEGSRTNRNNELQTYADSLDDGNITIENGCLNIVAKKEDRNGKNYTSASIKSQGKVSYKYGIFEIRARLPEGNGMWPAFWLMGETNFYDISLWPITGEIDIMESICGKDGDNKVYSTIHYGGNLFTGSLYRDGGNYTLQNDTFNNDYHTFGVVITDSQMLFYVDDVIHTRIDIRDSKYDTFRTYDKFMLINLAIGGEWAGNPDDSTPFPNTYSIDYVKIYQRSA